MHTNAFRFTVICTVSLGGILPAQNGATCHLGAGFDDRLRGNPLQINQHRRWTGRATPYGERHYDTLTPGARYAKALSTGSSASVRIGECLSSRTDSNPALFVAERKQRLSNLAAHRLNQLGRIVANSGFENRFDVFNFVDIL
jgi:hypothetical protein